MQAEPAIAAALAAAKADDRRVLVIWADPAHRDVNDLQTIMEVVSIRHALTIDYVPVIADIGDGPNAQANRATAATYQADAQPGRTPLFTVLDAAGAPLAHQPSDIFINPPPQPGQRPAAFRYSGFLILSFLERYQAPRRPAAQIYDAAFESAQVSDKVLWVRLSSALNPDSARMERWLAAEDVRSLLERGFVLCKLDVDRHQGIELVLPKFAVGEPDEWPWYAVVDGEGRVISRSQESAGAPNLGFPRYDEDVRYFIQWVGAAVPKGAYSTEELTALAESVKRYTIAELASSRSSPASSSDAPAEPAASAGGSETERDGNKKSGKP